MIILPLMVIILLRKHSFSIEFKEPLCSMIMECKSGYWQIKVDDESIPLIAFSAP